MVKQLYYEDVAVGSKIPNLIKHPTPRQLVMWAGVSTDFYEIHYDRDFAHNNGLPSIIVHGQLSCGFLGQMITDWIGDEGNIRKLTCGYKGMNFPGEALTCRGEVTKKYLADNEHYVEADIWVENPRGEKTALGIVVVTLPARE